MPAVRAPISTATAMQNRLAVDHARKLTLNGDAALAPERTI
jgi:hypothetical protein